MGHRRSLNEEIIGDSIWREPPPIQKAQSRDHQCSEPSAPCRLEVALSLIEHEWAFAEQGSDARMIVEIGHTTVRTIR
jgi:hypothetical protein